MDLVIGVVKVKGASPAPPPSDRHVKVSWWFRKGKAGDDQFLVKILQYYISPNLKENIWYIQSWCGVCTHSSNFKYYTATADYIKFIKTPYFGLFVLFTVTYILSDTEI